MVKILRYFKPSSTPSNVGIEESAAKKTNEAEARLTKKRGLSQKDCQHGAVHYGNAAALKKFRSDITDLGERSTWKCIASRRPLALGSVYQSSEEELMRTVISMCVECTP